MTIAPLCATVGTGSVHPVLIVPFALLLLLIATMPLTPQRVRHWWERWYPGVSLGLGALVAGYYLGWMPGGSATTLHTAHEYFSFITLIGSLFVVAGGIHLKVRGEATPLVNVVFLAIGAGVANLIGTTGASMVLIRPYLRMNRRRISAYHVIFFIFIVSNCGGALTPIGDPPLFLGFLRGIPFLWLFEHVVLEWAFTVGAILAAFYVFDRRSFRRLPARMQREAAADDEWIFQGGVNVLLLLAVIGAVFLPARWFLREIVMLAAAGVSLAVTPRGVHESNGFTFGPIREVGFLFAGIFATMMPALGYLSQHGRESGLVEPRQYYLATGALSSVLDNAPTYLNFLTLATVAAAVEQPERFPPPEAPPEAHVHALLDAAPDLVVAVSLGAVFFGAMTYIGNGPNFMVKSIAEAAGVRVPTFFGYVFRYAVPILLPILLLGGWLFL